LSDGNAGPAFNGQAPIMGVKQGQTYVVAAGDTVGTIADRTNTPIRTLIDLNNLQPPYVLQSGQRLVLQAGASVPSDTGVAVGQSIVMPSASPDGSAAPVTAPSSGVSSAALPPLPTATAIGQSAGTTAQQTVTTATQAPQSLQTKSIVTQPMTAANTTANTAANNATTSATNQINAAKTAATTTATTATTSATTAANNAANKATSTATSEPNVSIPDFPDAPTAGTAATTAGTAASQQLAAVTPTVATGSGQFGWPVQGQVISKFGATADGLRNDGINISAPAGAPVVAAADGVVAYAGNELRGFGNMILIRHANGWVTAYAHNQSLNVQKGDTVKRGQTIARVGQTGNVTAPQLHFEIRKGTSAQDPMKYLGS
jgi:murein DD-endopeptidase MepM/ murein hydrolase activator NlpD